MTRNGRHRNSAAPRILIVFSKEALSSARLFTGRSAGAGSRMLPGLDSRFVRVEKDTREAPRVLRRLQAEGTAAMMPFDTVFPDIAKNEVHVIHALDHQKLLRGAHLFREFYE